MNSKGKQVQGEQGWRLFYKAALVEVNPDVLLQRIAEAEKAISERAVLLLRTNGQDKSEQVTLAGAHTALVCLKRIYLADHLAKNERVA